MVEQTGAGRGTEPARTGAPSAAPEVRSADDAVLDPSALVEIRRFQMPGGRDVVATVIAMFIDECPQQLHRLDAAIGRQDAAELRAAAHGFKGSAAAMGARHVYLICQQLEDMGTAGTVVGAADLAAALADASQRTCTALAALTAPGELA